MITSQKINATLKTNGLSIAKRDGFGGWWTTQEAGFSTMKFGNSFKVTYYRTNSKSVSKLVRKAMQIVTDAGYKVSADGDLSFYVDAA